MSTELRLKQAVTDAVLLSDMEPEEAAKRFDVPITNVRRWVRDAEEKAPDVGDPIVFKKLNKLAQRAVEDFDVFGRRYMGRIYMPWQIDASNTVIEKLVSPRREFVVINCPPAVGKTTLFAHDIPLWLTVRDRSIRGLLGHMGSRTAGRYVNRLRRTLARPGRFVPQQSEIEAGRARKPMASLVEDFGRFKPLVRDLWTANEFIVEQFDRQSVVEKEATWTSYGMDSDSIGNRFRFINWDDLVTTRMLRSPTQIEDQRTWWVTEAEERLEPGGVLLLVGQRLGPTDLYRYCLDMEVIADRVAEVDGDAELTVVEPEVEKRYTQIIFQAHNEAACAEQHDPAFALPQPHGCLLDPVRQPWRDISAKMQRRDGTYETVLQQLDVAPHEMLVHKAWLYGGEDMDGSVAPGCWDRDRAYGQPPQRSIDHLNGSPRVPLLSYACVDPSGANYWAVEHWLYDAEDDVDFLVWIEKRKLQINEVLTWNFSQNYHEGMLEDMQKRACAIGYPLEYVVLEINAMNRWASQQDIWRMWEAKHNIRTIPHNTQGANKGDPELGVEAMCNRYRFGKIRLPGKVRYDEMQCMPLVAELTTATTSNGTGRNAGDALMASWFGFYQREAMMRRRLGVNNNVRREGPPRPALPWKPTAYAGR